MGKRGKGKRGGGGEKPTQQYDPQQQQRPHGSQQQAGQQQGPTQDRPQGPSQHASSQQLPGPQHQQQQRRHESQPQSWQQQGQTQDRPHGPPQHAFSQQQPGPQQQQRPHESWPQSWKQGPHTERQGPQQYASLQHQQGPPPQQRSQGKPPQQAWQHQPTQRWPQQLQDSQETQQLKNQQPSQESGWSTTDVSVASHGLNSRVQQFPEQSGGRGSGPPGQGRREGNLSEGRGRGRGGEVGRGRGARGAGGRGRSQGRGYDHGKSPCAFHPEPRPAQAPPLLSVQPNVQPSTSQGELVTGISSLKVFPTADLPRVEATGPDQQKWIIPFRKKTGTRGKFIELEVNHLPLILSSNFTSAIHYDCDFNREKISKKLSRYVMEIVKRNHYNDRNPAFDGRKNLFSSGKKPLFKGDELVASVDVEREGERERGNKNPPTFTITVTIKKVADVDLTKITKFMRDGVDFPQTAVQVLDVVLRNPSSKLVPVGRSFFSPPSGRPYTLGGGLDLWYGFYQTAVLGWKPYLNVDVAHKGFPQAKRLIDIMVGMMNENQRRGAQSVLTEKDLMEKGLEGFVMENFTKFIRGLMIEYEIPNQPNTRRKYKVVKLLDKPCKLQRFTMDDKKEISVVDYFKMNKRYTVKHPNLPCIHVGDPYKQVYLPAELCKVVANQVVMKKLDQNQTRSMIREAAKKPYDRKQRIMDAMKNVGFNTDPCVNEFGVSVSGQFQRVPARILDAPILEYAGNQVKVSGGVWKKDSERFNNAKSLDQWVILSVGSRVRSSDLSDFARQLCQLGLKAGMSISQPSIDILAEKERLPRFMTEAVLKDYLIRYFKQYKQRQIQMVVVVIPDRPTESYNAVKVAAEVEVGLLTQCVREFTMCNKMDHSTASNILLKINAKLNGTNHTVICTNWRDTKTQRRVCEWLKGTMLMGADVTHPSPDQQKIPSVAAVTASHDQLAFQYNMCWRLQEPKEEIIQDLQAIVRFQLRFYIKKNGSPPQRIIFYRDGVSEGQFSHVLQEEMSAIKLACNQEINKELPVTFLVVQKRHHTRLFPTREGPQDRNGNVLPGTVVDTDITHPKEMDFYMVSHASLQGTSRPTKYHLLYDDNHIDEDDLEELTYYLCHLFSRCNRTVSYPAPTYYAHLAATRGRVYLSADSINLDRLGLEMQRRTVQDTIVNNSPMFYT